MYARANSRPMPEGFAEDAFEMTTNELRAKYRCGSTTVQRWRCEVGNPRPDPTIPPADLAKIALTMSKRGIAKHYDVGVKRVDIWLAATGISALDWKVSRPWQQRPMPDDFEEVAPDMSRNQLVEHYQTSLVAVDRWLAATGITPRPPVSHGFRNIKGNVSSLRQVFRFARGAEPHVKALRNYDKYDEAADFMRHYGPCYRCDENGKANERGKFWRFGNVVMDREELLERAESKRRRLAA